MRVMEQNRKMLPTRGKIAEYWSLRHEKISEEDADYCFACGDGLRVERCHILARHDGGADDVSNLHVLCARCHIESEHLSGKAYWHWFNHKPWHDHIVHVAKRLAAIGPDNAWKLYEPALQGRMSRKQFDQEWHKLISIGESQ